MEKESLTLFKRATIKYYTAFKELLEKVIEVTNNAESFEEMNHGVRMLDKKHDVLAEQYDYEVNQIDEEI